MCAYINTGCPCTLYCVLTVYWGRLYVIDIVFSSCLMVTYRICMLNNNIALIDNLYQGSLITSSCLWLVILHGIIQCHVYLFIVLN